jgi:putative CocE/NonD family hydrolase
MRISFARPTRLLCAAALVAVGLTAQGSSSAAEKVLQCDAGIPIPGDDEFPATKLSANIAYPDSPTSGKRWPTVITVTPYGKDLGSAPGSCTDPDSGSMALTKRGFVVILIDQRGAGKSSGQADNEGGSVSHDGYHVLSWIQKQAWSNGKVGQYGCSALGMSGEYYLKADQQRVRDGLPRAVHALWADAPPAGDQYRAVSMGPAGAGSDSIAIAAPALIVGGAAQNNDPRDPGTVPNLADQAISQAAYLRYMADFHTDGPAAFIEDDYWTNPKGFWRQRATDPDLREAPVPVMLSAGYYDLVSISNGALATWMNLVKSPKRVIMLAPHGHCGVPTGIDRLGQGDRNDLVRRWFERYLKGERNGIDRMPNVNFFAENGNALWSAPSFPVPGTRYTPYYLNGSALTTAKPTTAGSARVLQIPANHASDEAVTQANTATFTSEPVTKAQKLGGLITADLYASITNPDAPAGKTDAHLTAQLYLVAADGTRKTLTPGWIRGGNRAVDIKRSVLGPNGDVVRPWHPNSRAAYKPVPSGSVERYQIEINPLAIQLNPGERLQLAVTAHDAQVLLSSATQASSTGGVMDVLYGPKTPSRVLFPILDDAALRVRP